MGRGGEEGRRGGGEEGKRGGGEEGVNYVRVCVQCSVAVSDVEEEDGESLSQICNKVCACKGAMTTYCRHVA